MWLYLVLFGPFLFLYIWIAFKRPLSKAPPQKKKLRRSKAKASFFHGPRQRWEVARTVVSSANNFSLSCRYPLKTEDHHFGGFLFDWSLHVSLRRAPKNYPSEGNFLEASHVNVELLVVQILWRENYQNTWNIDKKSTIPSKSQ